MKVRRVRFEDMIRPISLKKIFSITPICKILEVARHWKYVNSVDASVGDKSVELCLHEIQMGKFMSLLIGLSRWNITLDLLL